MIEQGCCRRCFRHGVTYGSVYGRFFGKAVKKRRPPEGVSFLICSFNFDDGLLHNREADDVDEPAQEGGETAAEEGRRIGRCQCVYAVDNRYAC